MEALGGVEPPTNSLGNCCSIHLSYRAAGKSWTLPVYRSLTQRGDGLCPLSEWLFPRLQQTSHGIEQHIGSLCLGKKAVNEFKSTWRFITSPPCAAAAATAH